MQLSKKLEQLDVTSGMQEIEKSNEEALYFDVIDDVMCIMHDDGSANFIEHMGKSVITTEVISAANILKVLKHYRLFKDVFKGNEH